MSKKVNSSLGGGRFVVGRPAPKGDAPTLVSRGRKALAEKRIWEAEQAARAALEKKPDFGPGQILLGLVSAQTGKAQIAHDLLERGLKSVVDDPEALDALANLKLRSGQLTPAKSIWQSMLAADPKSAVAHVGLGLCALGQRDPELALTHFDSAIAIAPGTASTHFHRARTLEALNRIREAIQAYDAAIKLQPTNPIFYPPLGALLVLCNRSDGAVKCFRKAYELDPKSSDGNYFLAQALLEELKAAEAEPVIRRALQLNTKSARAYSLLGSVQQQLGDFEAAKVSLMKAIELQPDLTPPYACLTTGVKFTEEDRPFVEKMQRVLETVAFTRAGQEQIHYALAKGRDDLKEYEQAMFHYDEANKRAYARILDFGHVFDEKREVDFVHTSANQYSKAWFQEHKAWGNASEVPLFVVGMIRSGTTLTEQILTSHPEIGRAGELRFWLDKLPTPNNGVNLELTSETVGKLASEYLEVLAEFQGPAHKRVTDKMPLNYMLLGGIHTIFPNARIIHCRRNPVDNCLSIYMTRYKGSPAFGHHRENIVFAYRCYLQQMEHWRATLPADRFLEVNYEDLVSDQEYWIRKMIDFAGLDWDDACLSPEKNEGSVSTPSLWQVRQPIYQSSAQKWRRYEPWLGAFAQLAETA